MGWSWLSERGKLAEASSFVSTRAYELVAVVCQPISQLYNKISTREAVKESWTKNDVLIVDEVSMVHPLLFTKLNILGQLLRKDPRPFGESLRKLPASSPVL